MFCAILVSPRFLGDRGTVTRGLNHVSQWDRDATSVKTALVLVVPGTNLCPGEVHGNKEQHQLQQCWAQTRPPCASEKASQSPFMPLKGMSWHGSLSCPKDANHYPDWTRKVADCSVPRESLDGSLKTLTQTCSHAVPAPGARLASCTLPPSFR